MKAFLQGADITVTVPLARDGEPFVPDNGTITWSLRGQDGSVLLSDQQMTGITDTTAHVVVAAANNAITAGRAFEKRTLTVDGLTGGTPFEIRHAYTLIPWLNYTATKDDVRTFVGVGTGELPDREIDLVQAYFDVASFLSEAALLDQALSSGDDSERHANRAIVAQAVLLLIPSLRTRISKQENDGTMQIERQDVDFDVIEDRASQALSRAINIIDTRELAVPALTAVTQRYDIFRRRRGCVVS